MAYELGAGLGIALFGLILSRRFSTSIALPEGLSADQIAQASSSIGETAQLVQSLEPGLAQATMTAAKTAFISAHSVALGSAGVMLLLLAIGIWFSLAGVKKA